MNEPAASRSSFMSELLLLLGILCGLGIIAAFFYWWGSDDRGFTHRKTTMLLNQLTRVIDERPNQVTMSLFVSYAKEADTTERLLNCDLDPETWLQVARQRADAIRELVSMGATDRAAELASLCAKLKSSNDRRAQELGYAAQCSLDFERQFVLCKHKMILAEIVQAASADENGKAGKQLAERVREHQKTDWRVAKIMTDLRNLMNELPDGNKLAPYFDRYVSQILDIEVSLENESNVPTFSDWIRQTQELVSQYPDNVDVRRSIVKNYDRLTDLQCYDEAKQLLDVALNGYEASIPTEVTQDVAAMIDRRSAAQIQLDRWRSLVCSSPDVATSLIEPIIQGAQQLQANQLVSIGIVERFIDVTDAFEDTQQYDSLTRLCDSLLVVFATNPTVAEHFKDYCAASSKRAALVGKPFGLPTQVAVEEPLDPAIFQDRVTAVLFWSSEVSKSLDMLRNLDQLHNKHKQAGFGLIAVNVDQNLELLRAKPWQNVPEWSALIATGLDATGKNPLAVEYGIRKTPYLILVDSQGVVADVALDVPDMWSRAGELLPSLKKSETPRSDSPSRVGR